MTTRTNEEWLKALKSDGEAQTAALSDLRAYLLRAAHYALYRRRNSLQQPAPIEIGQLAEDCAQDAVSTILGQLHQFRGDSVFTTWA
jgi:RNA polymerase sigma-70 factor (ECF subfamily)